MGSKQTHVSSPEVEVDVADIVGSVFRIHYGGTSYLVVVTGDKIEVTQAESSEPVGLIRRGSSRSGAILREGRLIGEYLRESSGDYLIIPVRGGQKEPEGAIKRNPLQYLLMENVFGRAHCE
jgi:hypothetical protein